MARAKGRDAGEDDEEEDLELMEQYDLMASDSEGDSATLHSHDTDSEREDDDDDVPEETTQEHYQAIRSTVIDITTALGGLEERTSDETGEVVKDYVIGDECLRCLRDLRTLLHQDQDDTSRVIPIIFSEVNVVQRGLLPLLLKAADLGERGSKIALACTDLLTSLTWPIDIVAEQQAAYARESEHSPLDSYQRMQTTLISYKAAILRLRSGETHGSERSVLSTIMLHILLPSLSKPRHRRNERDIGTISMCMHLFRNMLAIRDPIATSLSGAEAIALSNLQNDLLVELNKTHILGTLLMLASNSDSRDYEPWNVVTAECVYYMYADAMPEQILMTKSTKSTTQSASPNLGQQMSSNSALSRSLAAEGKEKTLERLASGASRHSRYSTAINFKDESGISRVARSQRALRQSSDQLTMLYKERCKRKFLRKKKLDEEGAARSRASWSPAAVDVVREWADKFVGMGFESLVRSVVKDIRSESAKAGNIAQTRTRIMRISQFFLEYFMLCNAAEAAQERERKSRQQAGRPMIPASLADTEEDSAQEQSLQWTFDLIGYWLEPWAMKMAWMRASVAREDRSWLEFVTAVQLWTTLLKLVELLGRSDEQQHREMSEGIYAAHFYDEIALDAAKSVIKTYTNQSFRCLETIIEFSHVMPRALERYSKDKDNIYVKVKRQVGKSKSKEDADHKLNDDLTQEERNEQINKIVESQIRERKFEFEKFQTHLSSEQLTSACMLYVKRYRDIHVDRFESQMNNVLHVLHRLAIKAGNVRLFFPYERRTMLKNIKADHEFWLYVQAHAPSVHKDLTKLVKYVLDKFDKLDEDEKKRWAEGMKPQKPVKVFKMPAEIELVPDKVASADQVRLAVKLMLDEDMLKAVLWIKQGFEEAIRQIESIDYQQRSASPSEDDDDEKRPSGSTKDLTLEYHGDGMIREWASKNPAMKMLCRLLGMKSVENDDHNWTWIILAAQTVEEHQDVIDAIEDAISSPFDAPDGEPLNTYVRRKRKEREPVRRTVINEYGDEEEVYVPQGRGARKSRQTFLDDDMIEDSDEEIEMAERLLAEQRERDEISGDGVQEGSARASSEEEEEASPQRPGRSSEVASSQSSATSAVSSVHVSPPKAVSARRKTTLFFESDNEEGSDIDIDEDGDNNGKDDVPASGNGQLFGLSAVTVNTQTRKRKAVVIDDEDDE